MAIYYSIYAVISITAFGVINKDLDVKRKRICFVAFILLFLMLALRHEYMGIDLGYGRANGYLDSFDKISNYSLIEAFTKSHLNYEHGYTAFNKLLSMIWNDRRILLVASAFMSIFPPMLLVRKKSSEPFLSIIIFIALPVFMMFYSGLRQSIAIGITVLASFFIQKKKPIQFVLLVLLAWTFHASSILFLVAYPMYFLKQNDKWKLAMVLSIPVLFLLRTPLFMVLSRLVKEEVAVSDTGAFTLFVIFYLIYIIMLIMNNRKNIGDTGYINLFYIACFCQIFSGLHNLAMRAGYYFMIYLIIALPNMIMEMPTNTRNDENGKKLFYGAVLVAFIIFGLYSIYTSTWARAYPYHFMWETNI